MKRYGIRFDSVNPNQISASILADLIKAYERAVISEYELMHGTTLAPEDAIVPLTSIESNCTLLAFGILPSLESSAQKLASLPIGNYRDLHSASSESYQFHKRLHKISKVLNTIAILFKATHSEIKTISQVCPGDEIDFERQEIKTLSSFYGKVIRVGGVEPLIRIELDSGSFISCRIDDEKLIYQAADLLYKNVFVKGKGTYVKIAGSSKLTDFEVETIEAFEPLTPKELVSKLAPLVEKQIARIKDPVEYFRRIRES